MEGFTPQFWLQVILTFGAVIGGYATIKSELKNIGESLKLERSEREKHAANDDMTFHDIRNHLQEHHGRLSRMEGQNDLAEKMAEAIRGQR